MIQINFVKKLQKEKCLCVRVCISAYVSVSHVASMKLRDADGRGEAAGTPK